MAIDAIDIKILLEKAKAGDANAQYNLGRMHEKGRGVAKDDKTAYEWYLKAAEQGNAGAQNNLGCMLAQGRGVAKDEKAACEWYLKAAEKGYVEAQFNLGWRLAQGRGVAKDEKVAYEWYRKAAEKGQVKAQYNLGRMLAEEFGVAKDEKTACEWYRRAAEQGYAAAQCNLGVMYEKGCGVPKDEKAACEWYRRAAEQGYAAAQCNLGVMYEKGCGVPKDEKAACEWYRRAAEQGYAAAQCNLGMMYEKGRGIAQDEKAACKWFRRAADQGHAAAQRNLGIMYAKGHDVAKDEKTALEWFRRAAEQGDVKAQFNLGWMLAEEYGVAKDEKTACEWFRRAADQGHAAAQFNLGLRYAEGRGVAKDEQVACEWYEKAAKQGDANAQYNLGRMLAKGHGVAKDEKLACEWYQRAAEQGLAAAQRNLGERFAEGRGVAKDEKTACEWYRRAAEQGHAAAQYNLGVMYEKGRGVPKDEKAACEWYRRAAEQGYAAAQCNLGVMYAKGRGVAKEEKAAFVWYQRAAEQGQAAAQCNLGVIFKKGFGVAKDKKKACEWFQIAAVQGCENAKKALEKWANRNSDIAKDALVVLSTTEKVSSAITPALYAIKTKAFNVIIVVKSIINDNTKPQDTIAALFWTAYYNNNVDVFEYILKVVENARMKQGQDQDVRPIQNKHGDSILALAVRGGHVETVRWLLTQGTYIDILNNQGQTPFSLLSFDSPADIRVLLQNAENLIEIAEKKNKESIDNILSVLGAGINARRFKDGNNALHLAIINKHVPLIERLLELDANLELLNQNKNSPFELADKLCSADKSDESFYIFILCLFKKLKNLAVAWSSASSSQKVLALEDKSLSEVMLIDNPFEILCEKLLSIIDKLNEPRKSEICYRIGSWFSRDECLVPVFAYKILMKVEKRSVHFEMANEHIRDLIMHGHIIFQKSRIQKNTCGLSLDEGLSQETLVPVFCDGINVPTDPESREIQYQSVIKHHMLAGNKKDPAVGKFLISHVFGEKHSVLGIPGIEGTDPDSLLKLFSIVSKRDPKYFSNHSEGPLNKMVQPVSSQKAAPMEVDEQEAESQVDGKELKEQKERQDRGDVKMQLEFATSSSSSAMMQFEPTASASGVSFPLNQFSLGKRKDRDSDDSSKKERFKQEQPKKDDSAEPPAKKLKT